MNMDVTPRQTGTQTDYLWERDRQIGRQTDDQNTVYLFIQLFDEIISCLSNTKKLRNAKEHQ